ncbi:MAG: lysylphosphatidylglycerol synthase domain-containing protein [Defluviitaleaceae bacterium]|nr:lysylphosphatidylglycerol synthase domain-containing protein [Defluviitaleaceae bacterium]
MMEYTRKAVSIAGALLMLISLVFVGIRIAQYDIDFSVLASPLVAARLLSLAFLAGFGYFFAGIAFQWLIKALSGVSVERSLVIKVYCISNLYKYIPGGVMYAVGRNRLVFETSNLSHSTVALATVLEIIIYALAGFVVTVFFALDHFISYMRQMSLSAFVWISYGGLILLCAALVFLFRKIIKQRLKKYIDTDFNPAIIPKLLGAHILIMLLQTVTYPVTLVLLGQPLTFDVTLTVIGLYAFSWLIGFLTPGAPSGLGVREAVMLMFLGGILDEEMLLSSMVIHRAMGVVGDVFVCGVGTVYYRISRKGTEN